ncbi:MAG: porin family protein [Bacteroidia bacterium]|nr:porin family protein [Bacteroidia bacterium]
MRYARLFLLLLLPVAGASQVGIGFKAGANFQGISFNSDLEPQLDYPTGFVLGAVARAGIGPVFVQGEAQLSMKYFRNLVRYTALQPISIQLPYPEGTYEVNHTALDFPVLLGVWLARDPDFAPRVVLGPVFSYPLGQASIVSTPEAGRVPQDYTKGKWFYGYHLGIGLDAEYVLIDLRFEHILQATHDIVLDGQPYSYTRPHTFLLQFTVGYILKTN